ncbi:hypothetical protein ACIXN8_04665 [Bacteroides fragilis]
MPEGSDCGTTVSSTLSLVWTMGLSERISGWLQRRKEAVHRQRIYRASAYFGSLLKHGEADAVAVRRCAGAWKTIRTSRK